MPDIDNTIALQGKLPPPPDVIGQITSLAQLQYLAAQGQKAQAETALQNQNVQFGQGKLNAYQTFGTLRNQGVSIPDALTQSNLPAYDAQGAASLVTIPNTERVNKAAAAFGASPTPANAAGISPEAYSQAQTGQAQGLKNFGQVQFGAAPSPQTAALISPEAYGQAATGQQTLVKTQGDIATQKGQIAQELLSGIVTNPDGTQTLPPEVRSDLIQRFKAVRSAAGQPLDAAAEQYLWQAPVASLTQLANGMRGGGQTPAEYNTSTGTTAEAEARATARYKPIISEPGQNVQFPTSGLAGLGGAPGATFPGSPFNGLPSGPLSPPPGAPPAVAPGLPTGQPAPGRVLGPPGLQAISDQNRNSAALPGGVNAFAPAVPGTIRNANEIPPDMVGSAAPSAGGGAGPTKQQVLADNAQGAQTIAQREKAQVTPTQLFNAFHGQESGSGANTKTSVDNAHGDMQIQPATFAQYAKPGEKIDNPSDNIAVGKRILADYNQRYGGDPARVAVAYFSGPNNVAPAGSPTPWINNAHDGQGTYVSTYVNGILGRLDQPTIAGVTPAPPGHDITGPSSAPATAGVPLAPSAALANAAAIPVPPIGVAGQNPLASPEPAPGTVAPIVPSLTAVPPVGATVQPAAAVSPIPVAAAPPVPGVTAPATGTPADSVAAPLVGTTAAASTPPGFTTLQPGMTLAQKAEQTGIGEAYGKLPAQLDAAASSAKTMNATLDEVAQAASNGSWTPGKWAPFKENLREGMQSVAQTLGIATPNLDTAVADYQDFSKVAGNVLRSAAHETSSRVGVQEMQLIQKSLPSPEMSSGGIGLVIPQMKGLNDFAVAKQQAAAGWRAINNGSMGPLPQKGSPDFSTYWNQQASPAAFVLHRLQIDNPQAAQTMVSRMLAEPNGKPLVKSLIAQLKWANDAGILP